jgi:hypothetical protein
MAAVIPKKIRVYKTRVSMGSAVLHGGCPHVIIQAVTSHTAQCSGSRWRGPCVKYTLGFKSSVLKREC